MNACLIICSKVRSAACLTALVVLAAAPCLAAPSGKYLHFDGTSDLATIPDANHLDLAQVTLKTWVSFDRFASGTGYHPTDSQFLVAKGSDLAPTYWLAQTNQTDQGMNSLTVATGVGGPGALGYHAMDLGQWYHVAGTYDGTTHRLFFNGQEIASLSTYPGRSLVNSLPLILGYCRPSWEYYLSGSLDSVAVWNHARSAGQIQADMGGLTGGEAGLVGYWPFEEALDSQVILDHSIYGNHGVLGRTLAVEGSDPTRVPEPATLAILVCGGLVLIRHRRAKRTGNFWS